MEKIVDASEIISAIEQARGLYLLEIAKRAKRDLFWLAHEVLGYTDMTEKVHGQLSLVLESLVYPPSEAYQKLIQPEKIDTKARDWEIFQRNISPQDMEKRFRLILMPRGSFKSTLSTISFPLMLMLYNPDLRILIDSETFDKSRAFLSEIRAQMESNDVYREIFKVLHSCYPDDFKRNEKWSDTELNVAARKKKRKEPNFSCAGVGTAKVGMHYDAII